MKLKNLIFEEVDSELQNFIEYALPFIPPTSHVKTNQLVSEFLKFIAANPDVSLETNMLAAFENLDEFVQTTNYDIKSFQKELFNKVGYVYIDELDLDLLSLETKPSYNLSIKKLGDSKWKIRSYKNQFYVEINPETGELTVDGGFVGDFYDLMNEIGEQAADALISDIKLSYPNALTERIIKENNLEDLYLSLQQSPLLYHKLNQLNDTDLVHFISDSISQVGTYRNLSDNDIISIVYEFLAIYKANPGYSPEICMVAAIFISINGIETKPSKKLNVIQKQLYKWQDPKVVYVSIFDLDLLTVKDIFDNSSINYIFIQQKTNSTWLIQHDGNIDHVEVDPKTKEVKSLNPKLDFNELMNEIGEQAADALIADIRKQYPNAIMENKVRLVKLLFNN